MKNKISFEEMLKSLKENRKESDVTSIDDRIESKKIDFKIETVKSMLEKWSDKKDKKSKTQEKMIKSFFWFLVSQSIFFVILVISKVILEVVFKYVIDNKIIYWYLSIFMVQIIALITISHRYMFSDNEDKILEIAKEIIKED